MNHLWIRVRDAIAGALDSMSLADLVPAADLVTIGPRAGTLAADAAGPAAV